MQPWKISVGIDGHPLRRGLDARRPGIFMDRTLLLDSPHRFLVSRLMVRRAGPGRADVFRSTPVRGSWALPTWAGKWI